MTTRARRELADAIDDFNSGWRNELATDRTAASHEMRDDRPTRAEIEAEEGWARQGRERSWDE